MRLKSSKTKGKYLRLEMEIGSDTEGW